MLERPQKSDEFRPLRNRLYLHHEEWRALAALNIPDLFLAMFTVAGNGGLHRAAFERWLMEVYSQTEDRARMTFDAFRALRGRCLVTIRIDPKVFDLKWEDRSRLMRQHAAHWWGYHAGINGLANRLAAYNRSYERAMFLASYEQK